MLELAGEAGAMVSDNRKLFRAKLDGDRKSREMGRGCEHFPPGQTQGKQVIFWEIPQISYHQTAGSPTKGKRAKPQPNQRKANALALLDT